MPRWVVAVFLFFGITVCESLCMANCVPGVSGGRWVYQDQDVYNCWPTRYECHFQKPYDNLWGTRKDSVVTNGNQKTTYFNFDAWCVEGWDRCEHLGGSEPIPVSHPTYGGVPFGWGESHIFTYSRAIFIWECCPNDPDKTDPGQCGCGEPDIDSNGDGVSDCADGKNDGSPDPEC